MSDILTNGLILPVLTATPPTPPAGTVALYVQSGQVKMVDASGSVTVLTNV